MDRNKLFEQCRTAARLDPEAPPDPDSLIGMFQAFRPDGVGVDDALGGLPIAGELYRRLERLYRDCGEDLRPQGGRDAYFIVRQPRPLDPVVAESTAREWLDELEKLAATLSNETVGNALAREIRIRVLEGIAPKHPKGPDEKSELLKTFESAIPELLTPLAVHSTSLELLRPAYYFIACDAHLRDYLMWPMCRDAAKANALIVGDDPFAAYYELWRHGVKFRIFAEDQIDLYLPRHA